MEAVPAAPVLTQNLVGKVAGAARSAFLSPAAAKFQRATDKRLLTSALLGAIVGSAWRPVPARFHHRCSRAGCRRATATVAVDDRAFSSGLSDRSGRRHVRLSRSIVAADSARMVQNAQRGAHQQGSTVLELGPSAPGSAFLFRVEAAAGVPEGGGCVKSTARGIALFRDPSNRCRARDAATRADRMRSRAAECPSLPRGVVRR
jgi:hypothetical protein